MCSEEITHHLLDDPAQWTRGGVLLSKMNRSKQGCHNLYRLSVKVMTLDAQYKTSPFRTLGMHIFEIYLHCCCRNN